MEAKNLLEYAILNGEVNRVALNEAIKQLPENIQQRFVELAIGIVSADLFSPNIPQIKFLYGHKDCRYKGYNYLYDRVEFEYDEEETRFFENEKDADRFSSTGDYSWTGVREQKDGYNIKASHVFKHTSECPLDTWMNAK